MPNDDHGHNHVHEAGHDHDHAGDSHAGHNHAPKDFGRAFAIGTALNIGFVILEAGYGFYANSIALLADAGHNLSDVFGLLMAWGASTLVKRPPTERFTYGYRSATILAALANGILLLLATGAICWEAFHRIGNPQPVAGKTVMIVAAIGVLINGFTAWLFVAGRKDDININGAYMHMAADAVIALGVVFTGLAILMTGWHWLDPVVSIVISVIIAWGTWGLLRGAADMALAAVPANIDPAKVRRHLAAIGGVTAIHDLHIWPMSTTETALTCHLVMPGGHPGDAFLLEIASSLRDTFAIQHATVQIECREGAACLSTCDRTV
jgi:cobalt-zinc-cadmium efflux system protein